MVSSTNVCLNYCPFKKISRRLKNKSVPVGDYVTTLNERGKGRWSNPRCLVFLDIERSDYLRTKSTDLYDNLTVKRRGEIISDGV